uniref:Uncharacterized protein n=1 Tax=Clytia hemisphaerica TaxID=252671 RepID=A0A7M5X5G6_9CNID
MAARKFPAKIYLHTKKIQRGSGSRMPNTGPLKHWSLVIHYEDENSDENFPALHIYDANNEDGILLCQKNEINGKDDEGKDKIDSYLKKERDSMTLLKTRKNDEIIMVSPSKVNQYYEEWNISQIPYQINFIDHNTCQEFVEALARKLGVLIPVFNGDIAATISELAVLMVVVIGSVFLIAAKNKR